MSQVFVHLVKSWSSIITHHSATTHFLIIEHRRYLAISYQFRDQLKMYITTTQFWNVTHYKAYEIIYWYLIKLEVCMNSFDSFAHSKQLTFKKLLWAIGLTKILVLNIGIMVSSCSICSKSLKNYKGQELCWTLWFVSDRTYTNLLFHTFFLFSVSWDSTIDLYIVKILKMVNLVQEHLSGHVLTVYAISNDYVTSS